MNNSLIRIILYFVLCLANLFCFAQKMNIDSLTALIKKDKDDTNKVIHLNNLAWGLMINNTDTAIILGNRAALLAEKLCNSPIPEIANEGKKGVAVSLGNLGVFYTLKANYPKALEYYLKALKVNEELVNQSASKDRKDKMKIGIAKLMGNIGIVYYEQKNYQKALDYYLKALKINEVSGNKTGIALNLGNIGLIYSEQTDYDKALEYYFRALKINEELGKKNAIAIRLGNIGTAYKALGDHKKALEYYTKALKIGEELGDKKGIASRLGNIGILYIATGKYASAHAFLNRALVITTNIGATDQMEAWLQQLSILYEKSNVLLPDTIPGKILNKVQMRQRALYYFKSHTALRDSIFSEESKKQLIQKEMNFEFEKKEALTKAEQDKKDALANEELKQKELQRNYFIIGFILLALLAGFIFRGYREKQKTNNIITIQKNLVEGKQKEIIDSIMYAKRIQQSLLPTEKFVHKTIKRLNS